MEDKISRGIYLAGVATQHTLTDEEGHELASIISERRRGDRQTGRTTVEICKAIVYTVETGKPAFFVIHNAAFLGYAKALWLSLGGDQRLVRFFTPTAHFHGVDPSSVFIDHHVFEVGNLGPSLEYVLEQKNRTGDAS